MNTATTTTNTLKNVGEDMKLIYSATGEKLGAMHRYRTGGRLTSKGFNWKAVIRGNEIGHGSLNRVKALALKAV